MFCFYISGFTLLTIFVFSIFYLAAFTRHFALRLAITPEFLLLVLEVACRSCIVSEMLIG